MSNINFMRDVGNRLKRRRKELGYTQSQLVELLNKNVSADNNDYISDKQTSCVESGHNYTKLDKFVAWCLALEKTLIIFCSVLIMAKMIKRVKSIKYVSI